MTFSRIQFEYPTGWTDINSDPLAFQHIECLKTISSAAKELGIDFQTSTCQRSTDFAQRYSANDTLLISVHTVGVARNVVRLKESYLPGLYYFDRSGYSGWAELAYNSDLQNKAVVYDSFDSVEFVKKIRSEKIRLNSSKYLQPNYCDELQMNTDGKPYILLALQTSDDLVARLSCVNQLKLAEALAEIMHNYNTSLVIKRHPRCCDNRVETTIKQLQRTYKGVSVSSGSINDLILGSKAVVTVNSGVGFEALVMGVPVITAGRSDYSFVTHNISTLDDLTSINEIFNEFDLSRVTSMIKYFIDEYCITCGNVQKAINFLRRWESEEYSSMSNMYGYEESVLKDIQNYISELEISRRNNCINTKTISIYEKLLNCFRVVN